MKFAISCFNTAKELIMIGVTIVGSWTIIKAIAELKANEIITTIGYFIALTIIATIINNFFEKIKNKKLEDK